MIRNPDFLETEKDSVILSRNYNFITPNFENSHVLIEGAQKWLDLHCITKQSLAEISSSLQKNPPSNPDRVLKADAERTFYSKDNQNSLLEITNFLHSTFGDYQQNISFLTGFLSLFLSPSETIALFCKIAKKEFLPGHFNAVATGAKTDILLFLDLAEQIPSCEITLRKILKEGVPTDFLKKWFSGLCVHLLPLKYLYEYFGLFLIGGFKACIKFGFAAFDVLAQDISKANGVEAIMDILHFSLDHFDEKKLNEKSFEIISKMKSEEYDVLDDLILNLEERRRYIFEEKVRPNLEMADRYAKENPVEEIRSCELCFDGFCDLFCMDCSVEICDDCHENPPAECIHLPFHEVVEIEQSDYSFESDDKS